MEKIIEKAKQFLETDKGKAVGIAAAIIAALIAIKLYNKNKK
jgi:hypothetical protein